MFTTKFVVQNASGDIKKMMNAPTPETEEAKTQQDYEWIVESGKVVKYYGGGNRKCECCGCNCPCKCKCCKNVCCTFSKNKIEKKK